MLAPNRVAVYLTAASGLAAAVAPAVANLDTQSTASVIAGFGGILAIALKWLQGWQKHEERQAKAAPMYATGGPIYAASGTSNVIAPGNAFATSATTGAATVNDDQDNSVLAATDGDALAPVGPVIEGAD